MAFKTHGTLKMLILGAEYNFHIILSYYVKGHLKKNSNLNSMSSIDFQVSEILILFETYTSFSLFLPSKLMLAWKGSYKVPKTIMLYWVHMKKDMWKKSSLNFMSLVGF